MPVTFSVPSSPAKSVLTIDSFVGADFTNSPAAVDDNKSPNTKNMIRSVPGKVRKSMGYSLEHQYDFRINGAHVYKGKEDKVIIHSGNYLYMDGDIIYSDMNDEISRSWQFDKKLFIQDGQSLVVFIDESSEFEDYHYYSVVPASLIAYIPLLTISKDPSGGGVDYEALNLLQPGFTEMFLADGTSKEYHMTFGDLDLTEVEVEILNSNADWDKKKEGVDFTVNRKTGVITFTTAPAKSPITGEDNVKITAYRTVAGYAERINECTIGIAYGVNGALDRLFVSGNSKYPNYDWYSQQFDATYFGDTSYAVLGSDGSAIVGYSIIFNYLATHKDEHEKDQSIIMRQGEIANNEPAFPIVNTLQGAGAIAKNSFAYLASEPVFLTRSGVYAVTAQDITGEKYAQNRSFFLNGKLLVEPNLDKAYACVHNDLYWLCLNDVCYILDGLQPLQTDKSMPYATRQYAGFYRTNVPARVMWEFDGDLFFGAESGKVFKFYSDEKDLNSYNDDGEPIEAVWETPDIDGKMFFKNKTFRYLALRQEAAIATSVKIYGMKRGIWNFIKEDNAKGRYLKFSSLIFSKFSFSSDTTQKIVNTKMRIKKVDKARFRFVNDQVNEPFGLYNIAFEYVESGNFKG